MSDSMKIRDRSVRTAYDTVVNRERIGNEDVDKLLNSAKDGRSSNPVTELESNELNWILYKHQDKFDNEAKAKMAEALGVDANNIPMPSLYIRDRSLRNAFGAAIADSKVNPADVQAMVESTKDGRGMTKNEKAELTMILNRVGPNFDSAARTQLADVLGIQLPPDPVDPQGPPKKVSDLVGNPRDITDIAKFSDTFKERLEGAKSDLVGHPQLSDDMKAERMMEFFKPYGEQFNKLSKDASGAKVKEEMGKVEGVLKDTGYTAALDVDNDKDGLTAATEIMKGTDPKKFSMVADHKVWTTTYWPMAGSGNIDGNPSSHLWAKDGALDKLDSLKRARGDDAGAKALEFERKPALNWLIGESDKGHYIPESRLVEHDAERTTGVDFDGDGRITDNVKADFLDAQGEFAAIRSRNSLVPKLGDETLTRKMETVDGKNVVNYYKADGAKVEGPDRHKVVLTNPNSDGKASNDMSVGWWGSCDKVALAGCLFEDPKKDVELNGVKFTKQDIRGLLTVLADSQARGNGFVGSRYDEKPDLLVTNDGKQLSGKIQDTVDFATEDHWRWSGDYQVLNGHDKDIKFKNFETGKVETIKAADIKYLAREDKKDMAAADFHHTLEDWLHKDNRPAAMDRDSGSHVWNYNFWKAERAEATAPSNAADLKGFNGPVKNAENLKFFETDVYFGESNYPRTYRYWIETDSAGKEVNSGWQGENPDFLWRPEGFNNWSGPNSRNPHVTPELVKEIYMKSIE